MCYAIVHVHELSHGSFINRRRRQERSPPKLEMKMNVSSSSYIIFLLLRAVFKLCLLVDSFVCVLSGRHKNCWMISTKFCWWTGTQPFIFAADPNKEVHPGILIWGWRWKNVLSTIVWIIVLLLFVYSVLLSVKTTGPVINLYRCTSCKPMLWPLSVFNTCF